MVGFEPTVWFPSQVNSLMLSASKRHANLFWYQRWESNPHVLRTFVSKTNAATVTPLWYFAQVEGLEPSPKVLETFMLPLHHTYVVVIPEGLEPPHLLVRSEMFYPIKLRNHFMWTISTEFFCCTSMFCTHVLFATEFVCLGFYNLFSSMDRNLILHPNTGDTIHSKRLSGNPYHILQNQVLLCFCVLTYSISFT
jgi:hypothetical protein